MAIPDSRVVANETTRHTLPLTIAQTDKMATKRPSQQLKQLCTRLETLLQGEEETMGASDEHSHSDFEAMDVYHQFLGRGASDVTHRHSNLSAGKKQLMSAWAQFVSVKKSWEF